MTLLLSKTLQKFSKKWKKIRYDMKIIIASVAAIGAKTPAVLSGENKKDCCAVFEKIPFSHLIDRYFP